MKQTADFERVRSTTGPHALQLLKFAGLVSDLQANEQREFRILDNAGGVGVVTAELFEAVPPEKDIDVEVLCGDISADAVAKASELFKERGWNASAKVVDGTKMDLPDTEFTHVVTAMGIMIMSDPVAGLREALRVLKPGGLHAFSTVAVAGWIKDFRDAISSKLGPENAPPFPDNGDFQRLNYRGACWDDEEWALAKTKDTGYVDVKSSTFQSIVRFDSISEYCDAMSAFFMTMLKIAWTKENVERLGAKVRGALLSFLKEKYGADSAYEYPIVTVLIVGRKPVA